MAVEKVVSLFYPDVVIIIASFTEPVLRSTHQKNGISLLFKSCFQNIFSELKRIVEIYHKNLAESRMFSNRFAWLLISPDRQSVSWWSPGITDHKIQNNLCCYMFTMLLLSNPLEKKIKSFFVHSFSLMLYYYFFSKLYFITLVIFIFSVLTIYVSLKALAVHINSINKNSTSLFSLHYFLINRENLK